MARGKAAAQAANRRLLDAQERITELERLLADEREQRKAEVTELQVELSRAQGALSKQVRELSDARVQEERDRANLEIKVVNDGHLDRVVDGMHYLESRPSFQIKMTHEEYIGLSERFGVDIGPLLNGLSERRGEGRLRETARSTNNKARLKMRLRNGVTGGVSGTSFDRWREAP